MVLIFLFLFSLLGLPVFNWFKREAGASFKSWLGRLVQIRGGILLFVIPLTLARALVLPFVPVIEEHGWLDFVYMFLFFILGYIVYSDDRFVQAVRRDRWLLFGSGVAGLAAYFVLSATYGEDVVIAVIDGGISPEHPALVDSREADRPSACRSTWAGAL